MGTSGDARTDASIDALFDGARSALIRVRAPMTIDPAKGPVMLERHVLTIAPTRSPSRMIA